MQATQSSTASGKRDVPGKFVALRHMSRAWMLGPDAAPRRCRPTSRIATRVSEGAGLAHDAGNLLGALSLYSDLLGMPGVLQEEHSEYAAELKLLSDRSWALIARLVNHARVEQEPGGTVLPEVMERCRRLLSKVAGRRVDVELGADSCWPVDVATEAVERIVTNLVKNAAEATPGDSRVVVRLKGVVDNGARLVVMTVSDTGCGMNAVTARALLEGEGVSARRGRGLGFRVVRELVALSDGCLDIVSEPGVGTSVSVEWRASPETVASDDADAGRLITTERGTKMVLKGEAGWIGC